MKLTLEVYHDVYFCEHPREDNESLGTLATLEKLKYNFGDEDVTVKEAIKLANKHIALDVYIYDHSGISVSTTPFNCSWDSGQCGVIYVSRDKVRKEYGVKRISKALEKKVLGRLNAEIEELNTALTEGYYGFSIYGDDGNTIDSCTGFLGTDWEANGIKDYIPKELWEELDNIEINYPSYI